MLYKIKHENEKSASTYIFAIFCPFIYTYRYKKWKKSDHLIAKSEKKESEIKKAEMKINGKNMQIFHSRGKKIQ